MKRQTKKQILEFLHFWPMTIVVPILLLLILFPGIANAKVKAKDIEFPGNFYTTEIGQCSAMGGATFDIGYNIKRVQGLIGYDWHADHEKNSNSLTVNHQNITGPAITFMVATHNAIGNGNEKAISIAVDLAVQLAKANTLHDSLGYLDSRKKPRCWKNSNVNAPCPYHEYQFARDVFGNYMITAIWLKPYMDDKQFKIVDKYIKKMYKKFLKPTEGKVKDRGFYQNADGGTPILLYASWTNNKKLAAKEINTRLKQIDTVYYKDGYINNNSFRGVRGYWYHSSAVNNMLGMVALAEEYNYPIDDKIYSKLTDAVEFLNRDSVEWLTTLEGLNKFTSFSGKKSISYNGKDYYIGNASWKHKNARNYIHQEGVFLTEMVETYTKATLNKDSKEYKIYKYKSRNKLNDQQLGFNPTCITR